MSEPIVSIRNLSKRFGSMYALNDVSIDIEPGEIFALLGPSGCGKSTLLRLIAGFESPTSGELLLDGKDMTRLPPNKRPVNMVFQSYAVFPHMSVADNIAYGLKMERVPAAERAARVSEALEQVRLGGLGERMPDQLSGGQRQRVALARALIKRPRVLLLDEPLSALDAKLRDAMRLELVNLQCSVGITFVIVTHDQSEALAMSDRIAVLESGQLRQVATPEQLYRHPADAFVADFIGNVHAFDVQRIDTPDDGLVIEADLLGTLSLQRPLPQAMRAGAQAAGVSRIVVRPEQVKVSQQVPPAELSLTGTLGDIAYQGQHSIIEVHITPERALTAIVTDADAHELHKLGSGATVFAHWSADDMLLLPNGAATA